MPFSSKFSILLVGASGYLGGTILTELVKKYPGANITALARSDKDDDKLKAAGVNTVIRTGSDNAAEVKHAAAQVDVVFNAANADDLPLVKAIIEGLTERKNSTGVRSIFIETSGAAVIQDDAEGDFNPNLKPVNDAIEEDVASVPPTAIHRNVDNVVFAADKAGDISGYVIAPAIIWGEGSGPVKKFSIGFGLHLVIAQAFKRGVVVGRGSAVIPTVHVKDVASLHLLVLDRALVEKDLNSSPFAKFYFASAYDQTHRSIMELVAKHLHAKGIFDSPTLEEVSLEEATKIHPLGSLIARNIYVKAERGAAIGWKPLHAEPIPPQDVFYALDGVLAGFS